MNLSPLPTIVIEPLVRAALLEDLGRAGDLTPDAIVPKDREATTVLLARQAGTVAGLDLAMLAFKLIDQNVEVMVERAYPSGEASPEAYERADGSDVSQGGTIASVRGPARAILTAERTALNFLCHLSGMAITRFVLWCRRDGHVRARHRFNVHRRCH